VSVEDLMEDRVTLDGINMKCEQKGAKARGDAQCDNARIANERLAAQNVDPAAEKKRQEDFERAREQLRMAQDKARQEREAKSKVDAYSLPVVPVEAQPAHSEPQANGPQADSARGQIPQNPPTSGAAPQS
jgi:hypothetical protein